MHKLTGVSISNAKVNIAEVILIAMLKLASITLALLPIKLSIFQFQNLGPNHV